MTTVTGKGVRPFGLLTGAGVGIAGAIGGSHRRTFLFIVIGALVGSVINTNVVHDNKAFAVGAIGAPRGATAGAVRGAVVRKLKVFT